VARAADAQVQAPPTRFEGAVGLVAKVDAEYAGAAKHALGLTPAGFIRYGRLTLSGAGGFTTRRNDDVERGLAARLVDRRNWRMSLGLRFDNGRRESDSDALAGLGDVRRTLRAQLSLRYQPDPRWQLSTGLSVDVLGRGGGLWADAGVSRTWILTPDTRLSVGAGFSWAAGSYLRTWYGVTPEQSARSGYPVYTPRAGLRDGTLGTTLRTEFGPHWAGFVSAGLSRQLGPVADSPLVTRPSGWSAGGGLVWRF
jgi:outer membrane scaffolding protein for murein synthesis (MipA/OmpV family)